MLNNAVQINCARWTGWNNKIPQDNRVQHLTAQLLVAMGTKDHGQLS